jgi:5-methylcytosine-specific restriction endonuclease McrA
MLCDYGCGQIGKYVTTTKKNCCSPHYNSCPANRKKNSNGLREAHLTNENMYKFDDIARYNSRLTVKENAAEKLLSGEYKGTNSSIKFILYESFGVEKKCQNCDLVEWQGVQIPLELDHINGDSTDNSVDNLRLLCPNCHSLTPTWRGRNVNTGKTKVADNILLTALKKCSNIRQALLEVGLAPKGGNYTRAKKLLSRSGGIGDTQGT